MKNKLSVNERLNLIAESDWKIAWDGCHKIYFLQDEGRVADAEKYEYDIYPSSEVKNLYGRSCGLRFVSCWGYDNDDFLHEWNINQCED